MLLDLFIGSDKLYNNLSNNDTIILDILFSIFRPTSVWHSFHHKNKVEFKNNTKKIKNNMSKEMIESIFESKNGGNVSSIIIGESSLPSFLKSLTEIVIKEPQNNQKKFDFDYIESISLFDNFSDTIKLTKNFNTSTLYEEKNGLVVYIRIDDTILAIQGILDDDILDLNKKNTLVKEKLNEIKRYFNYEIITVPKGFKNKYIDALLLRDILVCVPEELAADLKKRYNEYKLLKGKHLTSLINEFLLASKIRKADMLSNLLLGSETDSKLAFVLFDVLKMKDKKGIANDILNCLHFNYRKYLGEAEQLVKDDDENIVKISSSDIPYERRISLMNTNEDIKAKAIEKLKSLKNNFQGDNKAQSWLDGLLQLPFGIFKENSIMNFKSDFKQKLNSDLFSYDQINNYINENEDNLDSSIVSEWNEYNVNKKSYLDNVRSSLDEAVYGHKEAKKQLERIFAQWINGESKGAILGLLGPPGTGKTSLVKKGLSKCLMDNDNEPRPFVFLPIGGSVNGSTLVGHNYTYVGSTWVELRIV